MTRRPFAPTRADGRSMAEVIYDLTRDAQPGQTFTYADLCAALDAGADRAHTVADAQTAVRQTLSRLLHRRQRTLRNVRGVGYVVAHPSEHANLALQRKSKADEQLKMGEVILAECDTSGLTDLERQRHTGLLLVMSALVQKTRALEREQARQASLITRIVAHTGLPPEPETIDVKA